MDDEAKDMLGRAYESMDMNMRVYSKLIKISRTIADLDGSVDIRREHIAEAIMYRVK